MRSSSSSVVAVVFVVVVDVLECEPRLVSVETTVVLHCFPPA